MEKTFQSLIASQLINRLLKSGTGIIEGNYKSDLSIEDIEIESVDKKLSVHLSDFAGNYLGEYHVSFNKPKEESVHCELLVAKNGEVYNPLKGYADSICIILLPFNNDLGNYSGRFIADWGGPTAKVKQEDLMN